MVPDMSVPAILPPPASLARTLDVSRPRRRTSLSATRTVPPSRELGRFQVPSAVPREFVPNLRTEAGPPDVVHRVRHCGLGRLDGPTSPRTLIPYPAHRAMPASSRKSLRRSRALAHVASARFVLRARDAVAGARSRGRNAASRSFLRPRGSRASSGPYRSGLRSQPAQRGGTPRRTG